MTGLNVAIVAHTPAPATGVIHSLMNVQTTKGQVWLYGWHYIVHRLCKVHCVSESYSLRDLLFEEYLLDIILENL